MGILPKIGRRAFLRSQAALITFIGLPTLCAVRSTNSPHVGKGRYVKARWDSVTAKELSQFVGQRFRVRTEGYGDTVVRLSSVAEINSGPHRPGWLARREGLIANFESPDMEPLVIAGHRNYRIGNIRLGDTDLFMGPVPKRSGGYTLELILN